MCQLKLINGCMKSLPNTPRSAQGSLRPKISLEVLKKDISLQDTSVECTMGYLSSQETTYHGRLSIQWQAVSFQSYATGCVHCSGHVLVNRKIRDTASRQMTYQEVLGTLEAVRFWSYAGGCVYCPDHASVNRTIADKTSPKWLILRVLNPGKMVLQLWLLSWFIHQPRSMDIWDDQTREDAQQLTVWGFKA